jgi:hypothetical protein
MPPFPCCDLAARETITFHREYGSAFFDTSQGKFAILEKKKACSLPCSLPLLLVLLIRR